MAKKWHNQNLPGALHYLTGNVVNRIPIFKNAHCCRGFLDVCAELLQTWSAKLIVYVVMPDHIHLIVNPRDGDIQGFAGALKSLGAKKVIELTGVDSFD
jgi:REP element-mobilizing transposase RayT